MPKGYLKHNTQVNRKVARGGASHQYTFRLHTKQGKPPCSPMIEDFSAGAAKLQPSKVKVNEYKVGECPICFETVPVINFSKKCSWHESACFSCLRRIHVTDASKSFQTSCFHPLCQQPINFVQLVKHKLICTPEEIKTHHALVLHQKMKKMKDPHTVHCPHCDFPRVFSKKLSGDDRCQCCKSCGGRFLVSPDYATIRSLEWLEEDNAGLNDGWARCPHCGILISKGDGCNHMSCTLCYSAFDWSEAVGNRPPLARPRHSDIYLWW
jgi:hypothetical protein